MHLCRDDNKWCPNCNESVNFLHRCYIRTEEELKLKPFEGLAFFDFESCLNKENEHVVNLPMAQKVCKKCIDLPYEQCCQECHKKTYFLKSWRILRMGFTSKNYDKNRTQFEGL